jgi:hypothetical protein
MPSGLTASLLLILLDIYVIARTLMVTAPMFLRLRHQLETISDSRIQRASSLLLLEAITIASAAVPTNIPLDFIPFSIGGVIVLGE